MLDAEERPATNEEKAALVKYVGWGAIPQVFDVDNADWRKEPGLTHTKDSVIFCDFCMYFVFTMRT